MKIETKFNIGDTAYSLHKDFIMCVEIIDIKIIIFRNHDPIIYYICNDYFGDDTEYKINEKKMFHNTNDLKAYIDNEIQELLERQND